MRRVRDVANLINGFPFRSEDFDSSGDVPLVRIRDLTAREFELYVPRSAVPPGALMKNGDLAIGMDGDFNSVLWSRGPAALNQRVCILRPRKGTDIRFLGYALPAVLQIINDLTYSTTVKHLSGSDVLRQLIPFPNFKHQQRISRFLDSETAQIDELIGKQERLIELLDEKRQSVIIHAVTKGLEPSAPTKPSCIPWLGDVNDSWPLRPLKAAGHINLGKMIQPDPKLETDFEAPYLRAANVQPNGALVLGDVKNMWFKDSELQMLDVLAGDVVVVEGGIGGFGRAAFINRDLPGFGYQNSINRIRPSESVDGRFLTYLLLAARHSGYIHAYCTGVSMPHLTAAKLAAIRVPLPDRATQTDISDHIDATLAKLDALSDNASAVITLLHERRSALISAAVTGKIDVKEGVSA